MLTLERILLLKQVSLFSGLHIHELRLIAEIVEEVTADEGEILFNQGEPGDSMYVIIDGRVQILLADGTPFKVFSSFEAFGEMALLDDEPRSATAKAAQAGTLLRIEREKFQALLTQYPEICMGLLRMMSRRLRSELNAPPPAPEHDDGGTAFRH